MSGIQHSALSDEEFERLVYASMNAAGTLPTEVAKELAHRNTQGGRDLERFNNQFNPKQQTLPLDTK